MYLHVCVTAFMSVWKDIGYCPSEIIRLCGLIKIPIRITMIMARIIGCYQAAQIPPCLRHPRAVILHPIQELREDFRIMEKTRA